MSRSTETHAASIAVAAAAVATLAAAGTALVYIKKLENLAKLYRKEATGYEYDEEFDYQPEVIHED